MLEARSANLEPAEASERGNGVSVTVARYLEAVFYIEGEGETVRASRLAEWLGVSQPTAGATLQRMLREGLIVIAPTKAISLTEAGAVEAAGIVRRHRIAERWLTDYVGLDWTQADEEASKLEHALSDLVADRLLELIGRPTTCPHGNPIPGVDAPRPPERPLNSMHAGETSHVQRISEVAEHEAPELLRFLGEHGFGLDVAVTTREVSQAAGTVTVRVGERDVTLSLDVAGKIWVRT
jgi:DtxR family transcriptional regulator, Mn-dependent transcriptional regulator